MTWVHIGMLKMTGRSLVFLTMSNSKPAIYSNPLKNLVIIIIIIIFWSSNDILCKLVFLFRFLPDIIIKWKRVEISIRKVFEIFLQGNRGFSYRSNSFHVPLICSGRDPQLWELRTTSILKNEKGDFSLTRKKRFLGWSLFTSCMLQHLLSLHQKSLKGLWRLELSNFSYQKSRGETKSRHGSTVEW